MVRRPIICGQGALIEGDFAGMAADDVAPSDSIIAIVDNVAMVTREPIDRLQQIIAQSWYWIGGFCAPTDITTNPATVPTATNAAYKRAVNGTFPGGGAAGAGTGASGTTSYSGAQGANGFVVVRW